jgi:NAD(P)-dependent dehydrogenase (short-subunit alcohol dehydrogenase family)
VDVVITGGNSGVGEATAAALALAGHHVLIGCRSMDKARRAAGRMVGDVDVRHLDLADLASVRAFADSVDRVDVLINNAGVFALPLSRTADGFEAHMGINHLGHFALTCLLAERTTDRVISVGSAMYRRGVIHLDDLNCYRRRYSRRRAYSDSKLAVMLFIAELARRGVRAYASDPGLSLTDITRDGPALLRWLGRPTRARGLTSHPAAAGAASTLMAVTTDQPSGTYFAPWMFSLYGRQRAVAVRDKGRDPATARALWELSAELTGCDWPSS